MDIIHLTAENVVLSMSEPSEAPSQESEDDIRPINMECKVAVRDELNRLTSISGKYPDIDNIPSPTHIIRAEYEDVRQYKAAKDKYFKDYKIKIKKLNNNIKTLYQLNTELCRKSKKKADEEAIKNGTFYNADELQYLREKAAQKEVKTQKRALANKKYYEANKILLIAKQKKKDIENKMNGIQKNEFNSHLIKDTKIIEPLCLCGRRCDVINMKKFTKHSNLLKHRLFKSIIRLIHYNRRNRKLKLVIDKINTDLKDFKRVVRVKTEQGTSATITNMTDKEIIQLYTDYVDPFDENLTHKPRTSYIDKANTKTKKYQDNLLALKLTIK